MSAHIDFIDRAKRVLWICYEGRGDELEMNLRTYGVEYVPAFRHGRVGISYARSCPEDKGEHALLADSAEELVEILTMRSGVTKKQEKHFAAALSIVQSYQSEVGEAAS